MDHVVLAYDVIEDGPRARLFKRLKDHLRPVQKSVFEGDLDAAGVKKVEDLVASVLDLTEDSVRIYRLCPTCARRVTVLGVATVTPDADVVVW